MKFVQYKQLIVDKIDDKIKELSKADYEIVKLQLKTNKKVTT